MTGVASKVVLEISRFEAVGIQGCVAEVSLQELTGVPQTIDARVPGQPAGLLEVGVKVRQERIVPGWRWPQARRVLLSEQAQEVVDRAAARDEERGKRGPQEQSGRCSYKNCRAEGWVTWSRDTAACRVPSQ